MSAAVFAGVGPAAPAVARISLNAARMPRRPGVLGQRRLCRIVGQVRAEGAWATARIGGDREVLAPLIDPVIDAASNTFGVHLLLRNPDTSIPAGLRGGESWLPTTLSTRTAP